MCFLVIWMDITIYSIKKNYSQQKKFDAMQHLVADTNQSSPVQTGLMRHCSHVKCLFCFSVYFHGVILRCILLECPLL